MIIIIVIVGIGFDNFRMSDAGSNAKVASTVAMFSKKKKSNYRLIINIYTQTTLN